MLHKSDALIQAIVNKFGCRVSRNQVIETAEESGLSCSSIVNGSEFRAAHGVYDFTKYISENGKKEPTKEETEDDILNRLTEKFEALKLMSKAAAKGFTRAVIVSGPAGVGKTYEIIRAIKEVKPEFSEETDKISGMIRPTGLFRSLFNHSKKGQMLVFDDADGIFFDDDSLNLLKAACDTTKQRWISWLAETKMSDDLGEKLPNQFVFDGTIVFITNYDFHGLINRGNKLSPHFEALVSRAHYLDLQFRSKRDYLVRIKQVIDEGIEDLSAYEKVEILSYLECNMNTIKDLSLRKVIKLVQLKKIGKDWERLAKTMD